MSRYGHGYSVPQATALSTDNAESFHGVKSNRSYDHGSPSAVSEEDAYPHYSEMAGIEGDVEEDPNAALTSQTLNADGTPKRPMNAFMIFARRRRPQVSAENQSMRTGEISKILSREWNSMNLSDKQFYLDQAKILKESFNSKYPDYVYRRRPNNSRKKRRTEGTVTRSLDTNASTDTGDDLPGGTELEPSPIEGEDLSEHTPDLQYHRLPPESTSTYSDNPNFTSNPSRVPSYGYPSSETTYRQIGTSDPRMQYERNPLEGSALGSPRISEPQHGIHYQPYLHGQPSHNTPSSAAYTAEQTGSHNVWDTPAGMNRGEQSRGHPSWLGSKPQPFQPSGSWTASPASLGTPIPPMTQSPNHAFPTLNSPFYPNQSQIQGGYPSSGSSVTHPSYSPDPSQMRGSSLSGRQGTGYDHRGYSASPSVDPLSPYTPTQPREPQLYSQQARPSRTLPPVQSISTYSQSHSIHPSPSSSGTQSSTHMGYWARDKTDGQQ